MPNNLLQSAVEQYTDQCLQYEELGHYLEKELTGFTARMGLHPLIIMSRAKADCLFIDDWIPLGVECRGLR